jgi:hypothetical protein
MTDFFQTVGIAAGSWKLAIVLLIGLLFVMIADRKARR